MQSIIKLCTMVPKPEKRINMKEWVQLCNKIYINENTQQLYVYDRYTILNKDKVPLI